MAKVGDFTAKIDFIEKKVKFFRFWGSGGNLLPRHWCSTVTHRTLAPNPGATPALASRLLLYSSDFSQLKDRYNVPQTIDGQVPELLAAIMARDKHVFSGGSSGRNPPGGSAQHYAQQVG